MAIDARVVREELAKAPSTNPPRRAPAWLQHAAYVVYMSGSTGQPTGVVVTNAGLATLAGAQIEQLAVTPHSRVLQFASLDVDASVLELLIALTTGAALVILPDDARVGEPLEAVLVREQITHAVLPPALLTTLRGRGDLALASLAVGGEPCAPEVAARWGAGRRLVNVDGPTETTVIATTCAGLPNPEGVVPIGRPTWNTQAYVLDRRLHPAPLGVTGELYVAGTQLARGYVKRAALTASRFVANPFGPPGTRLYRTGDLVRRRRSGELEFQGLDRAKLPRPDGVIEVSNQQRAPHTLEQEMLCGLYAEILGVDRVGLDSDFFALGGQSVLAARLVNAIRFTFDCDVALRTVFEWPRVEDLAAQLRVGEVKQPPLARQLRPPHVPMSYGQEQLWLVDQLSGGKSVAYNHTAAMSIRGPLDVGALEDAVRTIVSRHEVLRTHFAEVDGTLTQVIAPDSSVPLRMADVPSMATAPQSDRIQAAVMAESTQPFDLARGPLLRLRLLRLAVDEHVLIRTMHHIVSDAWSQAVFNRELRALYSAYRAGAPSPLPPLSVQYADYAIWQRRWLEGDVLQEGLEYWRAQLAGIPDLLALPSDRRRGAGATLGRRVHHQVVPAELLAAVRRLTREHRVTLFMTLFAAFAIVLAKNSGEEDIVVGSPIANRPDAQLERLIGFFVNTLVLRLRVRGRQSFADVLNAARRTALDAYRYQHVPFECLLEALARPRRFDRTPIFQVVFTMQNAPWESPALEGTDMQPVWTRAARQARFDLETRVVEKPGQLEIGWYYNHDLFDQWRVEQWAGQFERVLAQVVEDAGLCVDDLTLLDSIERQELIEGWNAVTPAD